MLAVLTSHPIQYQAPIWRALAASGRVPFEVWFLTNHGATRRRDREFGQEFAWDVDLTSEYPHEFLSVADDWSLASFRGVRLTESLAERMRDRGVTHLWVEGWRLKPFWDAVGAAHKMGIKVWMRGDSNDLKHDSLLKRLVKRPLLRWHLARVEKFLCVGQANRRLYESLGAPRTALVAAPHCVDNDWFAAEADRLAVERVVLRRRWNIPESSTCVLFCGKLIEKKRPMDLVRATTLLNRALPPDRRIHLLFVGSGELEPSVRRQCRTTFDGAGDATDPVIDADQPSEIETQPTASLAGFVNQSQICEAYLAADVLVLPSDSGETWGLVVNECMASGIPAVVSDQCGCAEDLPARLDPRLVFRCGDVDDLARALRFAVDARFHKEAVRAAAARHHIRHTVQAVEQLYADSTAGADAIAATERAATS